MGIMNKLGSNLAQGLMGNLSEQSVEKLTSEYALYLMNGETIQSGFTLIRDAVIFTNYRIIYVDKQGATGQKTRLNTIYLDSVINVSVETAGFGIDDSEINIEYITSPYYKVSSGVSTDSLKLEFPKRYPIQDLYKWLQETAFANHTRINQ